MSDVDNPPPTSSEMELLLFTPYGEEGNVPEEEGNQIRLKVVADATEGQINDAILSCRHAMSRMHERPNVTKITAKAYVPLTKKVMKFLLSFKDTVTTLDFTWNVSVNDEVLEDVGKFTKLETLIMGTSEGLVGRNITRNGLSYLQGLRLKYLEIGNLKDDCTKSAVTEKDYHLFFKEAVFNKTLTHLEVTDLPYYQEDDDGNSDIVLKTFFESIAFLSELQVLCLCNNETRFLPSKIAPLFTLPHLKQLKLINFGPEEGMLRFFSDLLQEGQEIQVTLSQDVVFSDAAGEEGLKSTIFLKKDSVSESLKKKQKTHQ